MGHGAVALSLRARGVPRLPAGAPRGAGARRSQRQRPQGLGGAQGEGWPAAGGADPRVPWMPWKLGDLGNLIDLILFGDKVKLEGHFKVFPCFDVFFESEVEVFMFRAESFDA